MIARNDRSNGEFYVTPVYNYAIVSEARIGIYGVPPDAMHGLGTPGGLGQRDTLFVCPLMNGVLAQGLDVDICEVSAVRPVGKMFH